MKRLIQNMKSTLLISALLFFCPLLRKGSGGEASAQQVPFSSQYYTDQFVINPAFTGTNGDINAFLTHRYQWTGLQGAPQTTYLTIDGPVQTKNVGLGLKLYSDVTDMISRTGVFANYSYKLKISDSNNLYFGLALGLVDNKIDFSKAVIRDFDDPFLFQQPQNKTVFSADFGVAYVWKKLTIGFAVPQVLGNRTAFPIVDGANSYYSMARHYQGSAKYVFDVVKEKGITAYPMVMLRYVKDAPFQYDINTVIDWKKIGWLAATYHSNYAVAISGGVRYHSFSIGYAYDIGISKIRTYTGLASEFLLSYTFGNKKEQEDLKKIKEVIKDTLKAPETAKLDSAKVKLALVKTDSINKAAPELVKSKSDSSKIAQDQLKVKTDSINQMILVQLKSSFDMNQALFTQLKAKSDSSQFEIIRIKTELTKIKLIESNTSNSKLNDSLNRPTSNTNNDALLAKLKAKSDTNEVEINRLKAELAKAKTAEPKASKTDNFNDSLLRNATGKENEALLAQLKAKSDLHQEEIDKLKAELAAAKSAAATQPNTAKTSDSTKRSAGSDKSEIMLTQLKGKSDDYQIEIDKLKEELAKLKTAGAVPAKPENDALVAQLKAKAESDQAEIDKLKAEKEKEKAIAEKEKAETEKLKAETAKAKTETEKVKTEPEKEKTVVPAVTKNTNGMRTSQSDNFVDENGKPLIKGYYVVIGTFGNLDNAHRFKAASIVKGHSNTKIIQNQFTKVYNIYVLKTNNKDDADAERAKYKVEYSDIWILNLE